MNTEDKLETFPSIYRELLLHPDIEHLEVNTFNAEQLLALAISDGFITLHLERNDEPTQFMMNLTERISQVFTNLKDGNNCVVIALTQSLEELHQFQVDLFFNTIEKIKKDNLVPNCRIVTMMSKYK